MVVCVWSPRSVVESAKVFVTKVVDLKGAGFSAKGVFLLFHAVSRVA